MARAHVVLFWLLAGLLPSNAGAADPAAWQAVLAEAEGQTVYFNAWAGEPRINLMSVVSVADACS